MASLNSLYIKTETLETILKTLKAKGEKGVSITVSISDNPNNYGQNVSGYVEQTKKQRDAKKPKFYVGNGNTFWTDGKISIVKKETVKSKTEQDTETDGDLPF